MTLQRRSQSPYPATESLKKIQLPSPLRFLCFLLLKNLRFLLLGPQFLIVRSVEDKKFLVMKGGVGAEGQAPGVLAFDVDQQLFVFGLQTVKHLGINNHANVMTIRFL